MCDICQQQLAGPLPRVLPKSFLLSYWWAKALSVTVARQTWMPALRASGDEGRAKSLVATSMQAFENGLENFLSNAPGDGVDDDVADILRTATNGGEVVVRTMNGTAIPRHGPALGMFPSFLTFDPDHHHSAFTYL